MRRDRAAQCHIYTAWQGVQPVRCLSSRTLKNERLFLWRGDELVDDQGHAVASIKRVGDEAWEPAIYGRAMPSSVSRALAVEQIEHAITGPEWSLARVRVGGLGGQDEEGYMLMRRRITVS